MSQDIYNNVIKLNPPPFVTTLITSAKTRSVIFKSWSTLRRKSTLDGLSPILGSETELLAGFITRKGTQLRLEKALMLSNRIHKLGKRWLANKWLHEFTAFDDGVQISLHKKTKAGKKVHEEDIEQSGIRLPSRQWANWITYLTLRDCLILAKIKFECERTVKYWLGLISSSHHAADSLVAVGILSRIWYVSSSMVESLINVMYPTVCKLSIHLEPTKAENWLTDFEIPSPDDVSLWMEGILGSPFVPARLSKGMDAIVQGAVTQRKMDSVLETDSKSVGRKRQQAKTKSTTGNLQLPSSSVSVASTTAIQLGESSDEDMGVPVPVENFPSTSQQLSKHPKKKSSSPLAPVTLDEKWTRFFSGHKSKLKTDKGKKQFGVRIRKFLAEETSKKVIVKLKRLGKLIKSAEYSEMIVMINQFQKFLSKEISS